MPIYRRLARAIAFIVLPILIFSAMAYFWFGPDDGTMAVDYGLTLGSTGVWLLIFLLAIKPVSIILGRDFHAERISLNESFSKLKQNRSFKSWILFARDVLFSFSSFAMGLRRELGVSTFYFIFGHGTLMYISAVKMGSTFQEFFYVPFAIAGALGLTSLFIGWVTSNDIAMKKLGRYWKPIQRAAYFAAMFALLHLILIGQYEYIFVFAAMIALKFFEKYSRGRIGKTDNVSEVQLNIQKKKTTSISVVPLVGETLLEATERVGGKMPYSCRTGNCSACMCRILKWKELIRKNMNIEATYVTKDDEVLTCISGVESWAKGEILLELVSDSPIYETKATVKGLNYSESRKTVEVICMVEKPFEFQEGQFMNLAFELDGKEISRSYSISTPYSLMQESQLIGFSIKQKEKGGFSLYATQNIKVGDTFLLRGPFGELVDSKQYTKYLFVSVGSGVSPILSLYNNLVVKGKNVRIYNIHGEREMADIAPGMRNILAQELPNVTHRIYLSREKRNSNGSGSRHTDRSRHSQYLSGHVQDWLRQAIEFLGAQETTVFVCGRPDMAEDVIAKLTELGVPTASILSEKY